MTPFADLVPGDPICRPPWPYAIQVVEAIHHHVGYGRPAHSDHSGCTLSLRDSADGEVWTLTGAELEANGWFRASLTTEAAANLNATPASHYELLARRWAQNYRPGWLKDLEDRAVDSGQILTSIEEDRR